MFPALPPTSTCPPLLALAELVDLAAPRACAACGAPGAACCVHCLAGLDLAWFHDGPQARRLGNGGSEEVRCVSAGRYEATARALLHAYKDGDRRDLAPLLASGLLAATLSLLGGREPRGVALVPAPSGRSAERRRGDRPVVTLAVLAARASPLDGLQVLPVLRTARPVADQSRLDRAARSANVTGAYGLRRGASVDGRQVVVVDDVVTTGATATEAARVLATAGADVIGVATVLSTPRPGRERRTSMADGSASGPGTGPGATPGRRGDEPDVPTSGNEGHRRREGSIFLGTHPARG